MSPPIAVVTGASSGIGLELTKYLVKHSWNVVMADIQSPPEAIAGTKYIQTDVGSWESQASMFHEAYVWQGRLDFAALNAAITDRDDIFLSLSHDPAKPPVKPNMQTFDVDLLGVYYGIKLAAHYMTLDSTTADKPRTGGKIVLTASGAGLFNLPALPQYTAAKYGVVGLARSLGFPHYEDRAKKLQITVNAVCPAILATAIMPKTTLDIVTADLLTPMSTVLRAFEAFALLSTARDNPDWVASGPSGETMLATGDQIVPISPPHSGADQDTMIKIVTGFDQGFRDVNVRYAEENAKRYQS